MRLIMMGTGTFAEPTFEALLRTNHQVVGLVTQPDRLVGATRGSTRQARRGMKELALEKNIAVYQPESINTPEGVDFLKGLNADLLVVAAYGQILAHDVLAATPLGGINVHASLLPRYRGAAPVAWAIYHGETHSGVSIIRMSIYLDAGAIVAQEAIAIGADETAGELETRLADLGARLAVQVVEQFAAGTLPPGQTQDKSLVTKAPKLTKEHGLIDWTRPADAVCNQVRAMQPWPTAYTFLHREHNDSLRLIVQKAVTSSQRTPDHVEPGVLIVDPANPQALLVAAGENSIVEIRELQPSGKKRMPAGDFLRGYPVRPGDRMKAEE